MSISILLEMRYNSFNLFTRAGIFAYGKAPLSPAAALYRKAGFEYLGDYDVYIIRDIQSIEI